MYFLLQQCYILKWQNKQEQTDCKTGLFGYTIVPSPCYYFYFVTIFVGQVSDNSEEMYNISSILGFNFTILTNLTTKKYHFVNGYIIHTNLSIYFIDSYIECSRSMYIPIQNQHKTNRFNNIPFRQKNFCIREQQFISRFKMLLNIVTVFSFRRQSDLKSSIAIHQYYKKITLVSSNTSFTIIIGQTRKCLN